MGSVLLDPIPPTSSPLAHGHYPWWYDVPADNRLEYGRTQDCSDGNFIQKMPSYEEPDLFFKG